MNYYILQKTGYEIGNFINCTPTIKALSQHFGEPVPVLFEIDTVQQMFEKCSFIKSITQAEAKPKKCILQSNLMNKTIPDWLNIFNSTMNNLGINGLDIPHTYVDKYEVNGNLKGKKYIVIARGCLGTIYFDAKNPGDEIYQYILKKIPIDVVFVGGPKETEVINRMKPYARIRNTCVGNIKKTLAAINNCVGMVSNDTGVAHAAGALNKPLFMLWKNTNFNKNRNMGKNTFYSFKGNWEKDFDKWIQGVL